MVRKHQIFEKQVLRGHSVAVTEYSNGINNLYKYCGSKKRHQRMECKEGQLFFFSIKAFPPSSSTLKITVKGTIALVSISI